MTFRDLKHTNDSFLILSILPILASACRNQFLFVNWFFFKFLPFLHLDLVEYLVLLDICLASKNITLLQIGHLLINFILLAALHTWLTVHGVVLKGLDGAIGVHDPLLGQKLLL